MLVPFTKAVLKCTAVQKGGLYKTPSINNMDFTVSESTENI